jgi:hypothetical protein
MIGLSCTNPVRAGDESGVWQQISTGNTASTATEAKPTQNSSFTHGGGQVYDHAASAAEVLQDQHTQAFNEWV